jgi:hypothetical protein
MVVMIGYVREMRHVLICCAHIRGFFLNVSIILILWVMWTGFVWPLIENCGKLLRTGFFGLCKKQVSALLMERQLPVYLYIKKKRVFCDFENYTERNFVSWSYQFGAE